MAKITNQELDTSISTKIEASDTHSGSTSNPHSVTKTQVGLANVDNLSAADIRAGTTKTHVGLANVTNDAQLPIAGGTMTGILYPQQNTSYTTGQARRVILSTDNPSGGGNGDVWIKYT